MSWRFSKLMSNPRGLVVIHIDGLGYDYLQKALAGGYLPFVKGLLENEDYEVLPYRCGIPSTTPYCQAGILYGDNAEIPSYRWWDKQAGLLIAFGVLIILFSLAVGFVGIGHFWVPPSLLRLAGG